MIEYIFGMGCRLAIFNYDTPCGDVAYPYDDFGYLSVRPSCLVRSNHWRQRCLIVV